MRTIGGGRLAATGLSIGMKSWISATPSADMKRVIEYGGVREVQLLAWRTRSSRACSEKRPPFSWSSSDAKMLGESNRGQQNQSIVPSVATSAAVC